MEKKEMLTKLISNYGPRIFTYQTFGLSKEFENTWYSYHIEGMIRRCNIIFHKNIEYTDVIAMWQSLSIYEWLFTSDGIYILTKNRECCISYDNLKSYNITKQKKKDKNSELILSFKVGSSYVLKDSEVNKSVFIEFLDKALEIYNGIMETTEIEINLEEYKKMVNKQEALALYLKRNLQEALAKNFQIVYYDEISDKLLSILMKKADINIKNRLVAVVDTSFSGKSGKEGIIFSTIGIYSYGFLPFYIAYSDITKVKATSLYGLQMYYVLENGIETSYDLPESEVRPVIMKKVLDDILEVVGAWGDFSGIKETGYVSLKHDSTSMKKAGYEAASYEYVLKFEQQEEVFRQEREALEKALEKSKDWKEKQDALLGSYEKYINELEKNKDFLEQKIWEIKKEYQDLYQKAQL